MYLLSLLQKMLWNIFVDHCAFLNNTETYQIVTSHDDTLELYVSRMSRSDLTFVPRVSRLWNSSSGVLLETPNLQIFMSRINKISLSSMQWSAEQSACRFIPSRFLSIIKLFNTFRQNALIILLIYGNLFLFIPLSRWLFFILNKYSFIINI